MCAAEVGEGWPPTTADVSNPGRTRLPVMLTGGRYELSILRYPDKLSAGAPVRRVERWREFADTSTTRQSQDHLTSWQQCIQQLRLLTEPRQGCMPSGQPKPAQPCPPLSSPHSCCWGCSAR